MKLFIGNIPGEALLVDIYEFLGGLSLRADFHARQGKDAHSNNYHYVIAELKEPADIDRLINLYNGMPFQGQPLAVRQYHERKTNFSWQGEDRRINAH